MFEQPLSYFPLPIFARYCSIVNKFARPRRLGHLLRQMTCWRPFAPSFTKLWPRRIVGARDVPIAPDMVERIEFCILAIHQDIWIKYPHLPWVRDPLGFVSSFALVGPGSGRIGRDCLGKCHLYIYTHRRAGGDPLVPFGRSGFLNALFYPSDRLSPRPWGF